ncbi:hypothetical protein EUX98_g6664 [Antrodiella citrinella]|uniref:Autophagy-related protein 101 n=1 Tax=Antrodiella citrinella TaxID=2447956 RepID=A0A4S4MQ72_9APHY|nr:hypothetical protein EUX98_g6664 [Antrodiella citrinella]
MSTTNPIITLDLVLDRHTAKDVLRAVLHSILFHRLLGFVLPKTFEVLDVTMPAVDDANVEQLVDQKVDVFWKGIEGGLSKRGQISVTFSEKRAKKSWFLVGEVSIYRYLVPHISLTLNYRKKCHGRNGWLQYYLFRDLAEALRRIVNAEVRQPTTERDRQRFNSDLSSTLTKSLKTMLVHTSSESGRAAVPLITNSQGISPFPYKITVKMNGTEVG